MLRGWAHLLVAATVTAASTGYPVDSVWMGDYGSDSKWSAELSEFANIGGRTVWQEGYAPVNTTYEDLLNDGIFGACVNATGGSCVKDTMASLVGEGLSPRYWLAYNSWSANMSSGALIACPLDELYVQSDGRRFWRLVVPAGSHAVSCAAGPSREVDVLFAFYDGNYDSSDGLMRMAAAAGMDAFLGMPVLPSVTGVDWQVATILLPTYLEFTRRWLLDAQARFGHLSSWHGNVGAFYQGFETQVGWPPTPVGPPPAVMDGYANASSLVHATLPGSVFALSPYWDANILELGQYASSMSYGVIRDGITELARRGADIIAPQEGRGAGGAGIFWPHQADTVIGFSDPAYCRINPFVNCFLTFGENFVMSTYELFLASREGINIAIREGYKTSLWANLEAFELDDPATGDAGMLRSNKPRLDRGLTHILAASDRVVSWHWDWLSKANASYEPSKCAAEIAADINRPIVVNVSYGTTPVSGGGSNVSLCVWGYNIEGGATLDVSYWDSNWEAVVRRKVTPTGSTAGCFIPAGRTPSVSAVAAHFTAPRGIAAGLTLSVFAAASDGTSSTYPYEIMT